MLRTRRTALALAALALADLGSAALGARSALASSYTVAVCGETSTVGEWLRSEPEPEHVEVHDLCPVPPPHTGEAEPEGLYVASVKGATSTATNGTSGSWSFKVPSGLTITGFSASVILHSGGEPQWHPELRTASALLTKSTATSTWSGLSTDEIELVARCVVEPPASGCRDGATEHLLVADLLDPSVTIADPTAPALSSVGGALWSEPYAEGTLAASFDAEDGLVGVRRAALSVDGSAPLASKNYACEENEHVAGAYTKVDPCPDSVEGSLSLDTSSLSDGPHTVKLTIEDAAGNLASSEHAITVDNHGPPAPEHLSATETQPSTLTYEASWSDPPSPPAPIAEARVMWCAQSTGACAAPEQVMGTSTPITFSSPGPWTIYVQLVDTRGHAGAYGTLAVDVPSPPETTSTTTTTTTSGALAGTTTTTSTTSIHTSTTQTSRAKLTVSGVREGSKLRVSAGVPGARNGARVKLSAHIKRRGGKEVESCVADATVKDGRASVTFRLDRGGSRAAIVVVRARFGEEQAKASATTLKKAPRRGRASRRRRRARVARCVRPHRRRRRA
jgi:hypothetical protein